MIGKCKRCNYRFSVLIGRHTESNGNSTFEYKVVIPDICPHCGSSNIVEEVHQNDFVGERPLRFTRRKIVVDTPSNMFGIFDEMPPPETSRTEYQRRPC